MIIIKWKKIDACSSIRSVHSEELNFSSKLHWNCRQEVLHSLNTYLLLWVYLSLLIFCYFKCVLITIVSFALWEFSLLAPFYIFFLHLKTIIKELRQHQVEALRFRMKHTPKDFVWITSPLQWTKLPLPHEVMMSKSLSISVIRFHCFIPSKPTYCMVFCLVVKWVYSDY